MPGRAVIHVDLDAFYASVELKRRPDLSGRPLIVGAGGDPLKRGVVSAASYEARKYGIHAGMPLKKAHKLCPQAVFLPVDFEAYEKESERFMEILHGYSPLVESFGMDEAFIEIASGKEDPLPEALEIAREIRERIKRELKLTASAGIAPNKLLAKMASEMGKPDGLFIINERDIERTLRDLPVWRLWGVGGKTEKRLQELGINTIGELSKAPLRHLERNFGDRGKTLFEHARGVDSSPVVPFSGPGSLSRELTFEEDVSGLHMIRETLYALAEDLTARLKSSGYKARTVTIKIRYSNFKTVIFSKTFEEFTDSLNDIWAAGLGLLESAGVKGPVRLAGIKVSNLGGKKTRG